ncbi:DUF4363 family protein [Bacillus sp. CGMCC 1.16541]|uniref:DUF4363 family protein n=1 Tax=Bacillus sp. CGMCC 1.16541 TaxID=2185143 RepID=UPI0013A5375D|nr:DUF4363 family protein [Bacillus sp. CGMCC 1.16541]
MSQKSVTIWLSVALCLLYGSLYIYQYTVFFKGEHTFYNHVNRVMKAAQSEEWGEATFELNQVNNMWERGRTVIAIKNSGTNHALFVTALKRLEAAVEVKDEKDVIKEGREVIVLFKNIASLSPRF